MKRIQRILFALIAIQTLCSGSSLRAQADAGRPTVDDKVVKTAKEFLSGGRAANDAEGLSAVKKCCQAYIAEFAQPYIGGDVLPDFRSTRMKLGELLNAKLTTETRIVLIDAIVDVASKCAKEPKFSPAARINCVSLLGELDEAGDQRTRTRKPSTKALRAVLDVANNPSSPPYLKAVALQALERQTRDGWQGWGDPAKKAVKSSALEYASKKPDDEPQREMNRWLVRRALDVLRAAKADDAVQVSLEYLADAGELPSLRLSALHYLTVQNPTAMNEDQRKLYVLGLTHFLRSQLVNWYQSETDRQNLPTGSLSGGGMGMGGTPRGGLSMGKSGGDSISSDSDRGRAAGSVGRAGADRNRPGRPGSGPKPIDTQDWQARIARRRLNEITQPVHYALDGTRTKEKKDSGSAANAKRLLSADDLGLSEKYNFSRLIELVDSLQSQINDPELISSVQSVMNAAKTDIENLMAYSKAMPGFLEKYPDLRNNEDELGDVPEPSPDAESVQPPVEEPDAKEVDENATAAN